METVEAFAAERAAELFSVLGGRSVVLRLGWVFGDHDPIADRMVSAARKGWRLIEGDPRAAISSISATDAAAVILAAPTAPPGVYNASDGLPIAQAAVNANLERVAGTALHPLNDPAWGPDGTLFGSSRCLVDGEFPRVTGGTAQGTHLSHYLSDRVVRSRRHSLWDHTAPA